jgi:excisionase family DNA binding protein
VTHRYDAQGAALEVSMSGDTLTAELERATVWLLVPEVAERARVGLTTVRDWLRTGALRCYRPGGTRRVLVSSAELDRFIRGQAVEPAAACG